MKNRFYRIKTGELRKFARAAASEQVPSLLPSRFWHIYIKLEFQKQYENAETKAAGRSFVVNVARAASAAEISLRQEDGIVVEVQGSVIHCLLNDELGDMQTLRRQCRAINNALHFVFDDASTVEGWRMAADWGKTLLVRGRGIHKDDSYVSLGNAANSPAKHLYKQLAISAEEDRQLKRFMLGVRCGDAYPWHHEPLSPPISEGFKQLVSAELTEAKARQFSVTNVFSTQAKAVPEVASGGTVQFSAQPAVHATNEPSVYFGWVMRADLDGFTARVESCYDDDTELLKLGEQFESIMDTAAQFAEHHAESLIQLPWAGDNFTAAVILASAEAYRDAVETRYVEFSLDFSDAIKGITDKAGLPGWAQAAAGGDVHGNAHGNVYVGSVEFEGRRFLIGSGLGFGRSSQAFTDMKPATGELVIFEEDYRHLLKPYQAQFYNRVKGDGTDSTIFRKAALKLLALDRLRITHALATIAKPAVTPITIGVSAKAMVSSRPYANGESGLR